MDYVTVCELREKSGEIWQRIEGGEEFVVTRNGKPFARLVGTESAAVEQDLRALRAARLGAVIERIQAQAQASGASALTDEDIQAEIDAVRRQRQPHRLVAAEPAPRGHARRR